MVVSETPHQALFQLLAAANFPTLPGGEIVVKLSSYGTIMCGVSSISFYTLAAINQRFRKQLHLSWERPDVYLRR